MADHVLIAFDGSAAAQAAVRSAGALFPGTRATVLTIHEPAVGRATVMRAGGGLMFPDVVEQSLGELERELVENAEATAAEGVRLAESAGLAAEPSLAPGDDHPWKRILAAAEERGADVVACGSRRHGAVARTVLGSTSSSLLHHATGPCWWSPTATRPPAARSSWPTTARRRRARQSPRRAGCCPGAPRS